MEKKQRKIIERITLSEGFANSKKYENKKVIEVIPKVNLKNKGFVGIKYEKLIGIPKSSSLCDYKDDEGDAKTIKLQNGTTKESMDITMLQHILSEVVHKVSWENCSVFKKIHNLHVIPIHRDGDFENWWIGESFIISYLTHNYFYKLLKEDYEYVCEEIRRVIDNEEFLSTTTGPNNILQIRTKGPGKGKTFNTWNGRNLCNGSSAYSWYFSSFGVRYMWENCREVRNNDA
jgi:DNA mismatch repair protein MutH